MRVPLEPFDIPLPFHGQQEVGILSAQPELGVTGEDVPLLNQGGMTLKFSRNESQSPLAFDL